MDTRLQPVLDLAEAVDAEGLSGLLRTLPRMKDPLAPDISGCLADAEFCMGQAGSPEESWDCCIDLVWCLREAVANPDLPCLRPGDDDVADPRVHDPCDVATVALAALIFELSRRSTGYGKAES